MLEWSRELAQDGGEPGARGWRMVQAGEMPVPFPGSWCRLSGKGSPKPACVSSFLRVGSSNLHCSRARRTGTYHRGAGGGGGGGGPEGCGGGLCGFARLGEEACAAPASAPSSLLPHPGARASVPRAAPVDGSVRAGGGGGLRDAGQVMPPAGNWSWVSGPHSPPSPSLSPPLIGSTLASAPFSLPLWMKP